MGFKHRHTYNNNSLNRLYCISINWMQRPNHIFFCSGGWPSFLTGLPSLRLVGAVGKVSNTCLWNDNFASRVPHVGNYVRNSWCKNIISQASIWNLLKLRLFAMSTIRHYFDIKTMIDICYSFFYSHLLYGVLDNDNKIKLIRILTIRKTSLGVILKLKPWTNGSNTQFK